VKLKVKVCGITNLNDALLCESGGADLIGFIFYEKSKRFINFEEAKQIIKKLSLFTLKVGVFVNESAHKINQAADELRLNAVQLSGDENPELTDKIEAPVIKGFKVKEGFNFENINLYKNVTPLLDTFSDSEFGGTGKSFHWLIIPEKIRSKIFLAGGISIHNIEEVYRNIKPLAVDLSSSLENEPGRKDEIKVKDFFKKINQLRS
jgi:phosphoribosylanthranilate isomerase